MFMYITDPIDGELRAKISKKPVANSRASGHVPRRVGHMLNETDVLLRRFFEPFNQQLTELIGDERFLWRR